MLQMPTMYLNVSLELRGGAEAGDRRHIVLRVMTLDAITCGQRGDRDLRREPQSTPE